ncbi:reverse transcriptase domain-containing protein [Tanacetum coccineum]
MPPRAMTQAAIEKLVSDRVATALAQDRATGGNTNGAGRSGDNTGGNAGGQGGAPPARECTYSSFMKCNPTSFHGNEGAVELCRWFEKTESVFSISECAERNKVKFAATTLQGRALTWWNSQVATLGLEVVNAKSWNDMKIMMSDPIVEQNVVPMADNRTMAQMLQAPIEGYEDAIVVPPINANNFELKQPLINLVQSNKFTGRQDPHNHLRFFNKVTSTFRHPEVPNTSIKLLLFPFSLDGEARDWLDKEPPRSILTWDDLVSKFINQYFPPSKTTYYRNEIITFYQKPNEAFNEAWERFKGLLRQCPHHGFSELHQLDTFYNSLNSNDQDALDSAAGGNFLDKMPQEGLAIIESKSKVRYSRSRASDSRVSTDAPLSNSSSSNNSFDMQQIAASLEG